MSDRDMNNETERKKEKEADARASREGRTSGMQARE
jgi:hypothetical protein